MSILSKIREQRSKEAVKLLELSYGTRSWTPRFAPLDELIFTVLSQNTSDLNTYRSYERLTKKYHSWDQVMNASVAEIEIEIRIGGLSKVKAPRIKNILTEIFSRNGELSIDSIKKMEITESIDWLTSIPGVGRKTASCVLLFSFGMAAFPVDTHVLRVSKRLELVDDNISADKAHNLLEKLVDPEKYYQTHMDMIQHGRTVCIASKPNCKECFLNIICPSASL
tara:strand:- start:13861 stop:14532 length:672 start_codon:yes stop_codon:yes gene_type:complete